MSDERKECPFNENLKCENCRLDIERYGGERVCALIRISQKLDLVQTISP